MDLNSDGFSDLLVGAPMQSTIREEGRVYVYINSGSVSIFSYKHTATELFWFNRLRGRVFLFSYPIFPDMETAALGL